MRTEALMRGLRLFLFLSAALLMPTMSNAQPSAYGTPAPEVIVSGVPAFAV